jgi:hypothetical protein
MTKGHLTSVLKVRHRGPDDRDLNTTAFPRGPRTRLGIELAKLRRCRRRPQRSASQNKRRRAGFYKYCVSWRLTPSAY